jgi:ATP-binding cassette subfamily B protein
VSKVNGQRQGRFREILAQVRAFAKPLAIILGLEMLSTPLSLLAPIAVKIAIDSVVGSKPIPHFLRAILPDGIVHTPAKLLIVVCVLQVLVVLLIQLHGFGTYILKLRFGDRMVLNFRRNLFWHLQNLPLNYHDTRGTADSVFRIQDDAPALKSIAIDGAIFLASDVIKLLALVCVTLLIDWHLALVALSVAPLLAGYALIYQKRVGGRYKVIRQMESAALRVAQEVLSAIRVVKAFGRERNEEERFAYRSEETNAARARLAVADGTFGLAINLTIAIGMALVLFVGIHNVQSGFVTLGSLLMVITYLAQLYAPLQNITYHVASLQASEASVDRALDVLAEKRESSVEVASACNYRQRVAGEIEFRDVTFAYDPNRPILRDLSLRIPAGTRVGLVGRTGSGKTSLINMLVRFYEPTNGQILLDGIDLRDYALDFVRSQFALVLQEPVLFSTSIAKNIAYGNPSASEDDIISAAIAANAHDFIRSLPKGYETEVGERGSMLSGGERQRVSLARAFLKDAPILILDEPTSSLDRETEAEIVQTMGRLMQGRTCFFISHRLKALSNCDVLLKIQDGSLLELSVPNSPAEIESLLIEDLQNAAEPEMV